MRTPCEWTINDFVPKIRKELVLKLHAKDVNQDEIAKILGISQPRVSQYIRKEKKQSIRNIEAGKLQLIQTQLEDVVTRTVQDILKILEDKNKKAPDAIPIICFGCRELRMGNALCSLHRHEYKEIDESIGKNKNCDLCLKWKTTPNDSNQSINSLETRFNVLKILETIANILIMKLTFSEYIPQIGAQICSIYEDKDGDSLKNVASFPGRIIQIQGKAKIVSKPEFNSSKTTGSLLLKWRNYNNKITSVLSIKNFNDTQFATNLEKLKFLIIKTKEIDKIGFSDQIDNKNITHSTKVAIIDSGSIGFEPIIYLFVENIFDLVEIFD
jgi:hypothetical protein